MEVNDDLTEESLARYRGIAKSIRRGDTQLCSLFPRASGQPEIRTLDNLEGLRLEEEVRSWILAAEEPLSAACQFTRNESRYPWAIYALLRATLENAATAHWLLSGEKPEQRVGRMYLLEAHVLSGKQKYQKLLKDAPDSENAELEKEMSRFREKAFELGLDRSEKAHPTARLAAFDVGTRTEDSTYSSREWSIFSGAVHGSGWARNKLSITVNTVEDVEVTSQNVDLADKAVALGIWAVHEAHKAFSKIADVDLSNRITHTDFLSEGKQ